MVFILKNLNNQIKAAILPLNETQINRFLKNVRNWEFFEIMVLFENKTKFFSKSINVANSEQILLIFKCLFSIWIEALQKIWSFEKLENLMKVFFPKKRFHTSKRRL